MAIVAAAAVLGLEKESREGLSVYRQRKWEEVFRNRNLKLSVENLSEKSFEYVSRDEPVK